MLEDVDADVPSIVDVHMIYSAETAVVSQEDACEAGAGA